MPKLFPADRTLCAWANLIPLDGDLVFARKQSTLDPLRKAGFLTYSREEFHEQAADLWTLDRRAWHGYPLGRAEAVSFLKMGELEKQSPSLRSVLLKEQVSIGNTAVRRGRWHTAKTFSEASLAEKMRLMERWYRAAEPKSGYRKYDLNILPGFTRRALKAAGLLPLINTYPSRSGPNCFAFAASFALGRPLGMEERWLHPSPFFSLLTAAGFSRVRTDDEAELIVVSKDGNAVHAAVTVGKKCVIEKPGQSFYEPYRMLPYSSFLKEWPDHSLVLYGRDSK